MNTTRKFAVRFWRGTFAVGLAAALALPVSAQRPGGPPPEGPPGGPQGDGPRGDGPRGPRIDRADMEAAWRLEASHTASKVGLGEEHASQLETAYVHARQEQEQAMREGRPPGDGPQRGRDGAFREERENAMSKAREELGASLSKFLDETQTASVMARLGTFNREFDAMTHAIRGFDLGAKQADAMEYVTQYVIEVETLRDSLRGGGDFRGMRGQFEEKRVALDSKMASVLSAEQLGDWKEVAQMRRGGRDGRGGPPHGGPPQQ